MRDPEVAEDVAQEAVLAALAQRPTPVRGLRAWMRGAVRNLARLQHRRKESRDWHERQQRRGPDEADSSAADALLLAERSRALVDAVSRLPEHYRVVIVQRYLEGLQPAQIAVRLDVPVNTVNTRLARGLALLRRDLGAGDGADPGWMAVVLPLIPAPLLRGAPRPPGAPGGTPGTTGAPVAGGAAAASGALLGVAALCAGIHWGIQAAGGGTRDDAGHTAAIAPPPGEAAEAPARTEVLHASPDAEAAREAVATAVAPEDRMVRPAVAALHVIDALSGRPVAGATFRPLPPAAGEPAGGALAAYFAEDPGLAPHAVASGAAVSDARGRLEIDLPPGAAPAHRGLVTASGYVAADVIPPGASARRPATIALERAASLRLVRGASSPPGPLQVRLFTRGRGAVSPWVTLPAAANVLAWTTLPAGTYEAVALAQERPPVEDPPLVGVYGAFRGSVDALAGRLDRRGFAAAPSESATLVLFDHRGVDVRVQLDGVPPEKELSVALETREFPALLAAVATRVDDAFHLRGIEPGAYVLRIADGGTSELRRPLDVRARGARQIELRLSLAGGALVVHDADRSGFILVGPLDAVGTAELGVWDRFGADARFDALPSGEYELWRTRGGVRRTRVSIDAGTEHLDASELDDTQHVLTVTPVRTGADEPVVVDVYSASGIEVCHKKTRDGQPLELGLAEGSYRIVGAQAGARWFRWLQVEADVEVALDGHGLVDVALLVLRAGRPVAAELVGLRPAGEAELVDWMGSALRTSERGEIDARLERGWYAVRDVEGAAVEIQVQGPGTIVVELDG